jgi:hypothetical protein
MFTNLFARTKRTAPKAQLHVEALEDRWAPAHLHPGPGEPIEVQLPPAASHGVQGLETAGDVNHRGRLILILHD